MEKRLLLDTERLCACITKNLSDKVCLEHLGNETVYIFGNKKQKKQREQ